MKASRILIILVLVIGIFGYALWKGGKMGDPEVELVGYQAADEPFTMPKDGRPDMRFHFLSAWQANQIPIFQRMSAPMGAENGAMTYNAQKFWEMNSKRGGYHTGDDLNGIGGMNTDLGDPVYAASDGLVIYTGEPSAGWGKTIVIAHRDPQGILVQTMYAHLHQLKTSINTLVARGQIIGSVGTANGFYPAHLHLEVRSSDGVDIGAGYTSQPLNRLNPSDIIDMYNTIDSEGTWPSILAVLMNSEKSPWTLLDLKHPEKFLNLKK